MAVGNITNVIPASELPVMSKEELLANVTFVTVDGSGKMKQIPRPALFNTVATVVQKGDKGDTGNTGLTGPIGPIGPQGPKGDKGDTGLTGTAGVTGSQGLQGFSGWSPVISIVARSSDQVLQVINWTNPNPSATNKPTFPVYIATTGFTTNISEAVNIKGAQGLQGLQGIQGSNGTNGTNGVNGTNGWSPIITLKEDTTTGLVYFYLNSWVGGTGTPPVDIGYISQDGITTEPVVGSDLNSLMGSLELPFSCVKDTPTTLSGYGIVDTTDSLDEGIVNKYFSESRVRYSKLTDLTEAAASEIVETDDLITALGKLQAQITAGVGVNNTLLDGVSSIAEVSEVSDTDNLVTAVAKVQNQIRQIVTDMSNSLVVDMGGEGYFPYSVTDGTLYTESQVVTLTEGGYRILCCGSPTSGLGAEAHVSVKRYDTGVTFIISNVQSAINGNFNIGMQGVTVRTSSSSLIPEGSFSSQGHWRNSEGWWEVNKDHILKYVFDTAALISQPAKDLGGMNTGGGRGGDLGLSKIITVPPNSTLKLALEIPPPTYSVQNHDPTDMGTGFVWIRKIIS